MKILKLNHKEAQLVLSGKRTTWRLFDDKDLYVNDVVQLLDKQDDHNAESWAVIGTAKISKIVEKQLVDISQHELSQEGYRSLKALLDAFSAFYNRVVQPDTPVKIVHFDFTRAHQQGIQNSIVNETTDLPQAKMYADGGSRGNPGPSASGFVILDMTDQVVVKRGMYLGVTTNNQAEYQAVKLGLQEALTMGVRKLHVYLDSLLVVNQMNGKYKVRNRDLWPIHAAIKDLVKQFEGVSFTHVPRELNKLADGAVNEALNLKLSSKQ